MTEETFLFADLSGFTALTEAHGDAEAIEVVEGFFEAVGRLLEEHDAEQIKTIGDAVMLRCRDPAKAILLGVRIVEEIGGRAGFPAIRVGMHTGVATERAGDWFGSTVNLAARVAGAASGDEVLLTEHTARQAGHVEGVVLHEHGRASLRNVAEPVSLLHARAVAHADERGLPIDPVCRMAVDPRDAAGSLRHGGREYFFCSLACARAFAEAPDRFGNAERPCD